jgi:predicted nucleic acid-binding Zn ribbon protein
MTRHRRSPRSLSFALEEFRDTVAPDTILADVQRVWREAVGPEIAAEATPTSERRGVLTVSCAASVWAQELDLMSLAIVARVNELLGRPALERLRCISVTL